MHEAHHVALHVKGVGVHLEEGGEVVGRAADGRKRLFGEGVEQSIEQGFRDERTSHQSRRAILQHLEGKKQNIYLEKETNNTMSVVNQLNKTFVHLDYTMHSIDKDTHI